jgi:thiamine-phosphate diphosphorylase/hydroxyethylthiazole kinase
MAPAPVDYGVYLVTDSTPAILGDKDLVEIVRAAIQGGVTCVQYREKLSDDNRAAATEKARQLHAVTKEAGVPLLINDHVDIAVEIGCEGVHIGQDDMGMRAPHLMGL